MHRISGPPSLLHVCEGDPGVDDTSAAGTHKMPPLGDDGASCMAVDQAPPEEPRVQGFTFILANNIFHRTFYFCDMKMREDKLSFCLWTVIRRAWPNRLKECLL